MERVGRLMQLPCRAIGISMFSVMSTFGCSGRRLIRLICTKVFFKILMRCKAAWRRGPPAPATAGRAAESFTDFRSRRGEKWDLFLADNEPTRFPLPPSPSLGYGIIFKWEHSLHSTSKHPLEIPSHYNRAMIVCYFYL